MRIPFGSVSHLKLAEEPYESVTKPMHSASDCSIRCQVFLLSVVHASSVFDLLARSTCYRWLCPQDPWLCVNITSVKFYSLLAIRKSFEEKHYTHWVKGEAGPHLPELPCTYAMKIQ